MVDLYFKWSGKQNALGVYVKCYENIGMLRAVCLKDYGSLFIFWGPLGEGCMRENA